RSRHVLIRVVEIRGWSITSAEGAPQVTVTGHPSRGRSQKYIRGGLPNEEFSCSLWGAPSYSRSCSRACVIGHSASARDANRDNRKNNTDLQRSVIRRRRPI